MKSLFLSFLMLLGSGFALAETPANLETKALVAKANKVLASLSEDQSVVTKKNKVSLFTNTNPPQASDTTMSEENKKFFCDFLFVRTPKGSYFEGNEVGYSVYESKTNHKLVTRIKTKKVQNKKIEILEIQDGNGHSIALESSKLRSFGGIMFNDGSHDAPKVCPQISLLKANEPTELKLFGSVDPATIEL
jgi:hypothetical protein